jgi:DNA-binding CsgD family transcriptional regulator
MTILDVAPRRTLRAMPKKPSIPRDLVVSTTDDVAILRFAIDGADEPPEGHAAKVLALSPAEREVVLSLLQGKSNGDIAAARGTSDRTVANQIASIYKKLGVRSRAQLAAWCAVALPPK